jgi:glucan-binding YG repeat protein
MQSNGKAYKASDNSSAIRFRTIDGKRYAFDDDGQMLYGWVNDQGERQSDDDGWENATYYLGNWDDGAMKTGWQKVYVYDGDEEDDMEHWFNFKSNGKKRSSDAAETVKEEKINGQRYGFDNRGVMVYEWTLATNANASKSSSSSWKYYNSAEDGKRVTKGWFKVVAPSEDNDNVFKTNYGTDSFATSDADDENERWYYADGDGNLYAGQIKKIKGKYYGFRPEGEAGGNKAAAMLSGLVLMEVDPADGTIKWVFDDGVDADELDDLIDWDTTSDIVQKVTTNAQNLDDVSLYYFGDEETDGAMKTGATTVTLDGESYNFLFSKTGGAEGKGKGLTGVDDNKYIYSFGCRIKASSDDKYQVVAVEPTVGTAVDIHATGVIVQKIDSADLKVSANEAAGFINDKDETVHGVDLSLPQNASIKLYLVNTSGNIQKSKVAAKDGDDWYFYVKNRAVKLYTNNKNLDAKATDETEKWENYVEYLNSVN